MYTRSIFTVLVTIAAGCGVERPPASHADTASTERSATPQRDTTSTSGGATTGTTWAVTPNGIGEIRVGMSIDDVRRAAGEFTAPSASVECSYVHPARAPAGVLVMFARGEVARVDVDSAGVRSDAGVAIGDSSLAVTDAYAGRVTVTPHKYVRGGQYLSVEPASPPNSTRRIVFETENGRVTRFRSGRLPEVEWVERCG